MFGNSRILSNFLVFEGLDGSGTTTQLGILEEELSRREIPHLISAEPTTSPIGQLIREALSGRLVLERDTLARLFAADRAEHLFGKHGMVPRSEAGELVICDRYLFSSLAYQGSEIGLERVWNYNRDFPLPETIIFLDIPPEDGHRRYSEREHREIYEKLELQREIRSIYFSVFESLATLNVDLHIIDSRRSIAEISAEVWRIISNLPIVKM